MQGYKQWMVTASADNALCTASKAAAVGKTHCLTKIVLSYKTALTAGGLVQIKDGTNVIGEFQLLSNAVIDLTCGGVGLPITPGNAVSVELAASGTAGNLGKIILVGYTIGT